MNIVTKRSEDGALGLSGSVGTEVSATNPGGSVGVNANMGVSGRTGQVDYLFNGTFAASKGAESEAHKPDNVELGVENLLNAGYTPVINQA